MGTFRTLLAISVLITHSGPIFGVKLLNGDMAIHLFFVISGFLMSLILSEKYSCDRSSRRFRPCPYRGPRQGTSDRCVAAVAADDHDRENRRRFERSGVTSTAALAFSGP